MKNNPYLPTRLSAKRFPNRMLQSPPSTMGIRGIQRWIPVYQSDYGADEFALKPLSAENVIIAPIISADSSPSRNIIENDVENAIVVLEFQCQIRVAQTHQDLV
jgi:hypothetical protein